MEIYTDGPRLVLAGDFDGRSTWEVRTALYDHLAAHAGDVVLDLSEVTMIDMTALKVLAVATRYALAHDHHLTLRGCCPAVRRMLLLSRLNRMLEVEHTAASA
jgi:anti-anti-sigma factor